MSVKTYITEGPLPPIVAWNPIGAGAVICFEGVVRPVERWANVEIFGV